MSILLLLLFSSIFARESFSISTSAHVAYTAGRRQFAAVVYTITIYIYKRGNKLYASVYHVFSLSMSLLRRGLFPQLARIPLSSLALAAVGGIEFSRARPRRHLAASANLSCGGL